VFFNDLLFCKNRTTIVEKYAQARGRRRGGSRRSAVEYLVLVI
jgi:hypothetical protein